MAKKYTLEIHTRTSRPAATRQQGKIPAVLYGHGLGSKAVEVDAKAFGKVFRDTGSTTLISLTADDGQEHPVLIREIQYHPLRDTVLHIDFYQVRMDEEIRAQVPIHFVGESPAVKDKGGTLVRNMDELDLSALPQNLPHDIEVDISVLTEFDEPIRVSDLKLPEGIELHHEPDEVVALVQAPKSEEEIEAELAEEVKEDVEAVEGIKKEEVPAEGEEALGGAEGPPAEGEAPKKEE